MDLQSSHGTKINGKQLETARYYELRPGDLIEFATSTRQYVLLHDKAAYQIDSEKNTPNDEKYFSMEATGFWSSIQNEAF
eukprot:scaffold2079_cov173-Ochromonas_danica.AAC.15